MFAFYLLSHTMFESTLYLSSPSLLQTGIIMPVFVTLPILQSLLSCPRLNTALFSSLARTSLFHFHPRSLTIFLLMSPAPFRPLPFTTVIFLLCFLSLLLLCSIPFVFMLHSCHICSRSHTCCCLVQIVSPVQPFFMFVIMFVHIPIIVLS